MNRPDDVVVRGEFIDRLSINVSCFRVGIKFVRLVGFDGKAVAKTKHPFFFENSALIGEIAQREWLEVRDGVAITDSFPTVSIIVGIGDDIFAEIIREVPIRTARFAAVEHLPNLYSFSFRQIRLCLRFPRDGTLACAGNGAEFLQRIEIIGLAALARNSCIGRLAERRDVVVGIPGHLIPVACIVEQMLREPALRVVRVRLYSLVRS